MAVWDDRMKYRRGLEKMRIIWCHFPSLNLIRLINVNEQDLTLVAFQEGPPQQIRGYTRGCWHHNPACMSMWRSLPQPAGLCETNAMKMTTLSPRATANALKMKHVPNLVLHNKCANMPLRSICVQVIWVNKTSNTARFEGTESIGRAANMATQHTLSFYLTPHICTYGQLVLMRLHAKWSTAGWAQEIPYSSR